jgi:hypothetical protein
VEGARPNRIMRQVAWLIVLCTGLLLVMLLAAQSTSTTTVSDRVTSDARRIRTGRFTHRDLDHGKEVGRGTVTVRRLADSGKYYFSVVATFAADFEGFTSQRWEAIATPRLEPVSAKLASIRGSDISPVFELSYHAGRVTG